jgi:hypothetical protein
MSANPTPYEQIQTLLNEFKSDMDKKRHKRTLYMVECLTQCVLHMEYYIQTCNNNAMFALLFCQFHENIGGIKTYCDRIKLEDLNPTNITEHFGILEREFHLAIENANADTKNALVNTLEDQSLQFDKYFRNSQTHFNAFRLATSGMKLRLNQIRKALGLEPLDETPLRQIHNTFDDR